MTAGRSRASPGRRGGDADTRGDIVRAARALFVSGYADVSLRAVAREAGVDPALVVHFFGSKDGLFLAAMADALRPEQNLPAILGAGEAGSGARLAGWFFGVWEDEHSRQPFQAMLVSAAAHPAAADLLREFVTREIIPRVAGRSRRKDARLRAALAGSHLIGTALARYVYRIPPLCDVPVADVVAAVGASIEGYLRPA